MKQDYHYKGFLSFIFLASLFILIKGFIMIPGVQAGHWELEIVATGLELSIDHAYVNIGNVIIGIRDSEQKAPMPPEWPYYTVFIKLRDISSPLTYYFKDVRGFSDANEYWLLYVNVLEEIVEFSPDTFYPELSWDPNDIGPGRLELRRGREGAIEDREILIDDMAHTASYKTTVDDGSTSMWFTIVYYHDPTASRYCLDYDEDMYGHLTECIITSDPPENYIRVDFTDVRDCNDHDATINPGAAELCDGIDNNCNANIDEGFDQDNDGYTTCAGDCNDASPAINPGAQEVCDGIDNNCNAEIDENCTNDDGSDSGDMGSGYSSLNNFAKWPISGYIFNYIGLYGSVPAGYYGSIEKPKGKYDDYKGLPYTDERTGVASRACSLITPSYQQYQNLWSLSFLQIYNDIQREQVWHCYQLNCYQHPDLRQILFPGSQYTIYFFQPFWYQPYFDNASSF